MNSKLNFIERKAIDVSGRLGSLYDLSRDKLVDQQYFEYSTQTSNQYSVCEIFSIDSSTDTVTCLEKMGFDDALQLSILLGLVETSGVTSLLSHNQPIHKNMRFLYYSYTSKEEKLIFPAKKVDQIIPRSSSSIHATHMITKILCGFEILCVISISNDQSTDTVDNLLRRISNRLKDNTTDFILTDTEQYHIDQLTNVTIYGPEISINKSNASLQTTLSRIRDWQEREDLHYPLKYIMHSLRWLYNTNKFPTTYDLVNEINSDFETVRTNIILIDKSIKVLEELFAKFPENLRSPILKQQSEDFQRQFVSFVNIYGEFRKTCQNVLVDIRQGIRQSPESKIVISDKHYPSLRASELDKFCNEVKQWLTKLKLINKFNDDQIIYVNLFDISQCQNTSLTIQDIDAILKSHFSKEHGSIILWYSSDQLKGEKPDEWKQFYQQLNLERQQINQTSLIYVDFSQCLQKLENFIVQRLSNQSTSKSSRSHPKEQPLPSPSSPKLQRPLSTSSQQLSHPMTIMNILLLGETGVGKSTFINSFVNYLMFETLEEAGCNDPIVLIPASFITTIGNQFDEFTVKYGHPDSNENHEHQGQSVTQQCKSYLFNLNDTLQLRIIDTPGMSDTRGISQDEKNIDHILTYINNLSHLNAICFLFKPNTSRLNIFFRSCVNQLLTYLTPIAYNNILFCFTNARSTFFAPGNTGPLLRQILKQEYHDDISLQKENTFCFDSESFRYLAAAKCDVHFDDFQTQECIKSWMRSVMESTRLLKFIQKQEPYYLNEWQSLRKVTLEIVMLARPLMETLRVILYNLKLREVGLTENEIIIVTNPISIEICSNCTQSNIVKIGPFYITEYEPVKNKTIEHCLCPFDERHFLIESTVKHDLSSQPINHSNEELERIFHNFLFKCDRLINFLQQKGQLNQDGPFTPILKRFLDEERQIFKISNINLSMNERIMKILHSIPKIRSQNKQEILKSNEKLSLKDVYNIINELKAIPAVKEQIECIKINRQLKMEKNEYQIKIPVIKNKRFSKLTNSS